MKKTVLSVLLAAFSAGAAFAQLGFGQPEKINDGWSFALVDSFTNTPPSATASVRGQRVWQPVDLPHDWSVKQPLSPDDASCQGFLPGGLAWYTKHLNVPAEQRGKKVFLYFEGVYNRSTVYVNGTEVGSRPNGYISFAFDITDLLKFGADNVIAVRVDHRQDADSRWYTGSGIYRDVWLVYANPIHLAQWGLQVVPSSKGTLSIVAPVKLEKAELNSKISVRCELFAPDGKLVAQKSAGKPKGLLVTEGSAGDFTTTMEVKNPLLWSLETPHLYRLRATVWEGKTLLDSATVTTGFRTFTFDANKGFFLNGKNIKMKGVCIHHDGGVLGSAVPREVWRRRLIALKEIGVNAIRTSHNPQAPALYDLCDELGLLVLNEAYDEWEFPKNKWIAGWNAGKPGHQGSFDIFAQWGEQDLADMVRRDRNHPCVFAWSIGNEVDYPNDPYSHPILDGGNDGFTQKSHGGYRPNAPDANRLGDIAKRLAATVKKYDTSRPVTAGLAGVAMSNETAYPAALDICGYNYTESRYRSDHAKYPQRIIFGSENRHDLAAWQAVVDNAHIFGQFLWTGIDYLGESGRWPSRGFYSGLLDFAGFIKPRGYFRQSLWSDKPMVYVGTYPVPRREREPSMDAWPIWNYDDGQSIRVVAYTNAAQVQLLLNGAAVGEAKMRDAKTGIIAWDVPFRSGKLEAVAMDGQGNALARYAITSSLQPYALKITAADTAISASKGLAQIAVQVVDEHGVPVTLADNEVTCSITGGRARLLGLEAGNNSDMGDYTDNRQRAFLGRLLAYVQADGEAGTVRVKFTSPWLKAAEVEVRVSE